MKILELRLKKDVLIVDLEDNEAGFINGNYDFLCDGSELTEEIASELVDYWQNMANDGFIFENYKDNIPKKLTANDALISAVESKEKFWLENPIEKPKYYDKILTKNCLIWQEAEEKTFKNPLIFVKK